MSGYRRPMGCHGHVSSHREALKRWSGSNKDKYEAVSAAIVEFNRIGVDSCVFGSLACKLAGVACKPNDVDIIVLDTETPLEEQQKFLVRSNRQFYLLPSCKPDASFRVLWYKTRRGSRVKVDILKPNVMSVPDFMPGDIIWRPVPRRRSKIPMVPLEILLWLKLQGWDEHRRSSMRYYNNKQHADADHICKLLEIGSKFIDCDGLSPKSLRKAQKQVYVFVSQYPCTKRFWRDLGFRVRQPSIE